MIRTVSQSIYVYAAKLIRLIDGDTGEFEIGLGFKQTWTTTVRFVDVDVYEMRGIQANPIGAQARDFVEKLFADFGPRCYLHTDRDEIAIYNRVAGRPYLEDNSGSVRAYVDVIESLRSSGFEKGGTPTDPPIIVRIFADDIVDVVREPRLSHVRMKQEPAS